MARIKTYRIKGSHGEPAERYLVLFRYRGKEQAAGTFDDPEGALAVKQRAERAKREGRLDEFAAGLLDQSPVDCTLWEFMRIWFEEDAGPNLAEATLVNYLQVANKWIRPIAGSWPLKAFEKPRTVNRLLGIAQTRGVPRAGRSDAGNASATDVARDPTRDRIRKILSSALTWGVEHRGDLIAVNGCKQVTTRRRRRSRRSRISSPATKPERALTAEEAERLARIMLARSDQRTWQPTRDATILRCLFGLGMRPEEVFATRWRLLTRPTGRGDWFLVIEDALSHGSVTGVKTIERSKRVPPVVFEWLALWRTVAQQHRLPTDSDDFLIPGADPRGHFTLNQHKKWGSRYFAHATRQLASSSERFAHLEQATPYAARRGHITCRILAGEPVESVARSCGTSAATIYRHYFVAVRAAEAGDLLAPFDAQLADAAALR